MASSANAATQTWSGTASGVWDTSALNWDSGSAAWTNSNDALFSGTPTNNVTTATGLTIGTITLDNTFTGSVTMTGTNTVTGVTTINGGTLNLNAAAGLGASAITVNSGGTLAINPGTGNNTVSNNISGAGLVTAQDPGAASGNTLQLGGNLSGFTGTLNILAGASNNGKVNFSNTTQANIMSSGTIQVQSGATLYLNKALNYGANIELFGAGNSESLGALRLEANANVTGSVTLKGNSFIGANGGAGTISGTIGESGGSFGFTKVGNNTLTLSGTNSYTGVTTVSGTGTLQFAKQVSLYNNNTASWTATNLVVNSGATAAFNVGGTGEFTSSDISTLTGLGTVTGGFLSGSVIGFDTTNASGGVFTHSGAIANTNGGSNVLNVTKLGTGTLELSGGNTYTGGTRANAGTLIMSGSHTHSGTADFLSVNNVGAQNAVLKITSGAGTQGYQSLNVAEATNARGAIYHEGGTFSTANTYRIAGGNNSYGYSKLSGGTVTNTAGDMLVGSGNGSTGVMDVTGGSLTTGSWLVLGRNGGTASGLLNVTGGSVTSNSNNIALNWGGSSGAISILNVGGGAGAASVTGVNNAGNYLDVSVANVAGQTGVVNVLSNGTLTVSKVQVGGAASTALFNFNGGTLKANAANAGVNFMNSANMDAVTVYSGGGTIDNNGTNITIGNTLGAATGNGVTSIAVTDGGSGYIGAPMVKITGGTGNTATGYAVMVDDGTGNGTFKVSSIVITSPGTFTVDPTTVTLSGGGATTAATIGTIATAANTSGGMTFAGAGTTTLSAANTYTGGTLVSNGTLATSGTGTLGTGNVTLDGTSPVVLTLGSAVSFGDSATLTFALNSTINMNFTGSDVLGSVTNGSLTLAAGSYTASQLNSFFGGSNFVDAGALGGTLTVVPEPHEFALAIVGLLGVMVFMRRRNQQA